jgi:hypothetical protein
MFHSKLIVNLLKIFDMKNLKLFIAVVMLLLTVPLSIFAQPGITSDRNVSLIHGLGDPQGWIPFRNFFTGEDNRRMSTSRPEYSAANGLNSATTQIPFISSNTVVIAHSLGGVIARRADRSSSTAGIITVGSPLDGAPIANALQEGRVNQAVNDAANQLSAGPLAQFGYLSPLITFVGQAIRVTYLADKIDENVNSTKFGGVNIVNDIKVGGSAVEQDKNTTPTTTPKISIWGNENTPIHWNILASSTGENVESIANTLSTVYEVAFFVNLGIGAAFWYSPYGWWAFYTSYQWYNGWQWISNDSERVWNNLIGSDMVGTQCYTYQSSFCIYPDERCDDTPQNWQYCQVSCFPATGNTCVQVHNNGISDAFIPAVSQRGEGSNSWRIKNSGNSTSVDVEKIEAPGVNHQEEVDANNTVMRDVFRDIFFGTRGAAFRIDKR